MKRTILASLLALCAIAGQAQNSNSVSPDSVIIEGVVTNIADGTRFMVLQEGVQGMQETIVKDGKFRIAIFQKEKESSLYIAHGLTLL